MECVKISVVIPVYNVENFIYEMLESVQNQTFKDFEVILVNDGSKDNSQEIIDRFCAKDKRFKSFVQENQGVAAARNNGLKRATGEYVVFYDPDDYIPEDALYKLYNAVSSQNADIGIGIMRESTLGEYRYNASTIRMGKSKTISRFDKDLLWSFSVCNKIFRRGLLTENKIEFPKFKHAEDAVFLFKCIFASSRIVGCNTCVYEYKLRPIWESKSATQVISYEYLKDVTEALDEIESLIIEISILDPSTEKEGFLDEFYARYLDISLFVGYYRFFWSCDEACIELLKEKVAALRQKISEKRWDEIVKKNKDLQLQEEIFDKKTAIEKALLTFVIKPGIDEERLQNVINSIYRQSMPFFVILADESYKKVLSKNNFEKENIVFKENLSIDDVNTEYVLFVDPDIIFSKNSIKFMMNSLLSDEKLDFVTLPLKILKNGKLESSLQNAAFTVSQCLSSKITRYNRLDNLKGNKLVRKHIAREIWDKPGFDYKDYSFKKISNATMVLTEDSHSQINSKENIDFMTKLKLGQIQLENQFVKTVKKHFTKEDVKRILRKI